MADAPRPGDLTPLEQAQAYAEGRSDDVSRELVGEMLASHAALQAAGEEMPGLEKLAEAFMPGQPNACDPGCRFEDEADRVLDLFRPIVARLRQRAEAAEALAAERLARAERAERERDVMSERVAVVQEDHADMAKAHGERACEVVTLRTRVAELESRPEPGADVVERLCHVMMNVESERAEDIVRAVLFALAAMGEEAWPDVNTIGRAMFGTVWERYFVEPERANHRKRFAGVLDLFRSRLSPVIGALRARVAELEGAEEPTGGTT